MIIILDSDACGRLGFISLSITDRVNLLPVCILLALVEVGGRNAAIKACTSTFERQKRCVDDKGENGL